MSLLGDLYIKKETLKTLLETVESKGDKGVSLTISINDETNDFGQNISCYVSQTKEQRSEKKKKFYAGNGKVFWTNGVAVLAKKIGNNLSQEVRDKIESLSDNLDDLPF